jgi:hypothetical protein
MSVARSIFRGVARRSECASTAAAGSVYLRQMADIGTRAPRLVRGGLSSPHLMPMDLPARALRAILCTAKQSGASPLMRSNPSIRRPWEASDRARVRVGGSPMPSCHVGPSGSTLVSGVELPNRPVRPACQRRGAPARWQRSRPGAAGSRCRGSPAPLGREPVARPGRPGPAWPRGPSRLPPRQGVRSPWERPEMPSRAGSRVPTRPRALDTGRGAAHLSGPGGCRRSEHRRVRRVGPGGAGRGCHPGA